MSAWDREEAVKRYAWRLRRSSDPVALMRHFGSPTKVAVELAKGYVSSPPPPGFLDTERSFAEAEDTDAAEGGASEDGPDSLERFGGEASGAGPAGRFFFLLFAVVIGAPVALALLALGLPFVGAGVGVVMAAAAAVGAQVGALPLLSDVLLLSGAGLAILGVGILVVWFGVWLGFSLCRLWLGGVVGALGKRVYGEL